MIRGQDREQTLVGEYPDVHVFIADRQPRKGYIQDSGGHLGRS